MGKQWVVHESYLSHKGRVTLCSMLFPRAQVSSISWPLLSSRNTGLRCSLWCQIWPWMKEREREGGVEASYSTCRLKEVSRGIRKSLSQNWPTVEFNLCLPGIGLTSCLHHSSVTAGGQPRGRVALVHKWNGFQNAIAGALDQYASWRRRSARCIFVAAELRCWLPSYRHRFASLAWLSLHSVCLDISEKGETVSVWWTDTVSLHTHKVPHQQGRICQAFLLSPNQSNLLR